MWSVVLFQTYELARARRGEECDDVCSPGMHFVFDLRKHEARG
jgi:hypothetical protein